jgi:2-(1,2-epoxy-1,2-dihydrophenyl)acetyl-CoA isomerase
MQHAVFATREFETLICDVPRPRVGRITLNRPAAMNAYTWAMTQELYRAVADYRDDDDLRVLILRGAGRRAFCAGGDIGGADEDHREKVRAAPLGMGREMRDGMQRVLTELRRIDKPSIAQIEGYAVAGGLALALACDFRLGSTTAKLGDTSNKFGLLPDEGGAWLFPFFMGYDKALKMSLLHEIYDAEAAFRLGLLTEVVTGDLEARAFEFADALAEKAPLAVRCTKMMMSKAVEQSWEASLADAQMAVMITNPSEDVREARAAFREKRKALFQGR